MTDMTATSKHLTQGLYCFMRLETGLSITD